MYISQFKKKKIPMRMVLWSRVRKITFAGIVMQILTSFIVARTENFD